MFATLVAPCTCAARALAFVATVALLPLPALGAETIVGSGATKTETRAVSGFRAIALGVAAEVQLRQGSTESLSITGDDNIVARVETVVEDGTLKIRWPDKGNFTTTYKRLVIDITAKTIEGLAIAGSGQIHSERLKTGNLRVGLYGSGVVSIDPLEADSVSASIGGSGSLQAAGRADSIDASLAGTGRLAAAKLESRTARVTLAGSGDATVWATETLVATVVGSGDVKYYGKPAVRTTIAGSGRVVRAGESP